MFAKERNWRLLDLARDLNKVWLANMDAELKEIFLHYRPKNIEQMRAERREIFTMMLLRMQQDDPEGLKEFLTKLKPEE